MKELVLFISLSNIIGQFRCSVEWGTYEDPRQHFRRCETRRRLKISLNYLPILQAHSLHEFALQQIFLEFGHEKSKFSLNTIPPSYYNFSPFFLRFSFRWPLVKKHNFKNIENCDFPVNFQFIFFFFESAKRLFLTTFPPRWMKIFSFFNFSDVNQSGEIDIKDFEQAIEVSWKKKIFPKNVLFNVKPTGECIYVNFEKKKKWKR